MRIAIVSCFYPFRGGISQFSANLYQELGKSNDIKAFNFSRQYPDFLFPGKTQYVTPEDEAEPIESDALLDSANPFTWRRTAKAIADWQPDLVIICWWMSFFGPSLGCVAHYLKRHGIKTISLLHNVIPHERKFFDAPLTKYFLNGCDAHITLSDAVKADLKGLGDYRSIQLFHPIYSHFGDKLDRETADRNLGIKPGGKNILFFGLIREYKGLDILLEAFKGLPEEYNLIIAGEPYGSFAKYQTLIDECPDSSRVHCFLEYVRDSEVKRYFSASDVTVLPYRSATQSGVSSVSYHFEVPMIVTDVGGLKSAIGDTGTGMVVAKADPDLIRKAIVEFFENEELRENCIQNIKKEKKRLGWQEFCKEMLNFANCI